MELCDNSLQKILDEREEGFTCEQIFNIMSQLNKTFKIMYENKIIHRDIKLDNILVKYKDYNNNDSNINFIVKLTDYGISKRLENTNTTSMGTFQTMAPEILEGKKNYDNKCDLWSIGIIIYQLFFKEYPYKGTPVAIYNQIKEFGKKLLKKTKNDKLDNLIDSLLIREPEKRINYEEYFNHPFFKENYIESEIEIGYEVVNARIINSYEEWCKDGFRAEIKEEFCNEKEIKENCEIRINNKIIPFAYFYEFKNKGIYRIKYSFKNYLKNTNYMFANCYYLSNINLSNFKTKNVTNMSNMFFHCSSLENINLSNFKTKNVTDMSHMFSYCKFTNINLSNFNTQNITDMSYMFNGCFFLKNINLSNFNTQNVTNMRSHMFDNCESLKNINLSNFNTKNVTNMSYMLFDCKSLTNINLSNFNTQNVTDMSYMFDNCESLKNINLSHFNTQNVTDMSYMFHNCYYLKNINLSNFNNQNVTNMCSMFNNCESLTNINLSNFNTQNVTDMSYMFHNCASLTNINLSNFNTQNVTYMRSMFHNCESLKNINLSNFNTQNVIDMSHMFFYCKSLTNINLSNFNTKNVKNMSYMFNWCKSLEYINLSNFNTQNANDMWEIFSRCYALKENGIITKDKNILKIINNSYNCLFYPS